MPENNKDLVDLTGEDNGNEEVTTPTESPCCKFAVGSKQEITIDKDHCSFNAEDLKVKEKDKVLISGKVVDCDNPNKGVSNVLVQLLKEEDLPGPGNRKHFVGVAYTITGCDGDYLFDVEKPTGNQKYKIVVGKAATSRSKDVNGNNQCDPCVSCP